MKAKILISAALFIVVFGVAYAWDDDDHKPMRFSDWSAPVNLGEPVNSVYMDSCISISKDKKSLFFSSTRPNGPQGTFRDLYVSERASTRDPWGDPQPLTTINSDLWDSCPALGLDEHWLFFTSYRPDEWCGEVGFDIYVSYRKNPKDNLGWEPAVNLGCEADGFVNSDGSEITPAFFRDETGAVVMYFGRWFPGMEGPDIYQSRLMRGDDCDGDDDCHERRRRGKGPRVPAFGPAVPVTELNTEAADLGPTVRRDGLEMFFVTNREFGNGDLWTATRKSTFHPWSELVPIEILNSESNETGRISLSHDGRELYFRSDRPEGLGFGDFYVAKREKLRKRRGHR